MSVVNNNFFARKFEELYVVWFCQSNQWVVFNDRQWFIFELYNNSLSESDTINQFCGHFGCSAEESSAVVKNVYASLDKLIFPDFELPDFTKDIDIVAKHILPAKKTRYYRLGKKCFSIVYGSRFLEEYIHLPFAYLQTDKLADYEIQWELFFFQQRYALRSNGLSEICFTADEAGQIKRLLYIQMANFLYNKELDDWMAHIHGSAVIKDRNLILFSSESGSGKSTIAYILQKHGFSFFSDDFVPVDLVKNLAYPFPAAPSIKKTGLPVILNEGLGKFTESSSGTVYVKPDHSPLNNDPEKVKAVIFVRYKKGDKLAFKPLPFIEALSLFMNESWVIDDLSGAQKFIEWFSKLRFFTLEFGDNSEAVKTLQEFSDKKLD